MTSHIYGHDTIAIL